MRPLPVCSILATSLPQVASQPASVQPTFHVPDPASSLGGELQLDTKVPGSLLRGALWGAELPVTQASHGQLCLAFTFSVLGA